MSPILCASGAALHHKKAKGTWEWQQASVPVCLIWMKRTFLVLRLWGEKTDLKMCGFLHDCLYNFSNVLFQVY